MRFKVMIPWETLYSYSEDQRVRALGALNAMGLESEMFVNYWNEPVGNYDTTVEGDAPAQAVTLLAAMAQGHPITRLLDAAGV